MICIKADIPKELNDIDDELKAIYHSEDTVCFYIFKTRDLRNEFVEKTISIHSTINKAPENLWLIYLKTLKKDQEDQRLYPVVNLLIDL